LGDAPARSGGEREARSRRHPPRRHNYRRHHRQPRPAGQHQHAELPTLDGCGQYRKLVWLAHRASNTAINYTIRARATDLAGTPLGSGWQTLASGTFAADAANPNWVRLDIPATGDGYYDQYRIEVSVASGTVTLTSKIVGVR
jgi:hypothetical protein